MHLIFIQKQVTINRLHPMLSPPCSPNEIDVPALTLTALVYDWDDPLSNMVDLLYTLYKIPV